MDDNSMQLHTMDQQLIALQEQLDHANQQQAELMYTMQSVDEMSEIKEGTEFLAPMGNGIFIKGNLKETNKFVVNVGSGVCVSKNPSQLKDLLSEQRKELTLILDSIKTEISKIKAHMNKMKGT